MSEVYHNGKNDACDVISNSEGNTQSVRQGIGSDEAHLSQYTPEGGLVFSAPSFDRSRSGASISEDTLARSLISCLSLGICADLRVGRVATRRMERQ